MQEDDLFAVISLESENPSPWSGPVLDREMKHPGAMLLVAEEDNNILAWLGARIIAPEAELLKLAVLEKRRREGLAQKLFACLVRELLRCGCLEIFLEVRSANSEARSFYAGNGFVEIGRRVLYFRNPDDDALVLKKVLHGEVEPTVMEDNQ